MSPRGRPVSMAPSLSASGPISVTPRSSHPTDSSHSERARSASGLMCTREPLPSGCLRQLSSNAARRIGADTCPAGRPVGDACARTPRVPSPSRRRRTFPLPVAPTRANVDGRRLPRPPPRRDAAHAPARNRPLTATHGAPRAAPPPRTFGPQGPTLGTLIDAYLQDYQVRQFRSHSTARGRTAHLTAFFGRDARAATLTTYQIRQYQLARRAAGAATGTINRETSALHRMGTLAVHWGWLDTVPGFPDRHASVASAESHSVTSPRWTKACSYADQFPTRYFVLYFGWTFDLMSRSCTRSGHRGQRAYSCLVAAEGLCTNACAGKARSRGTRCRDVIFETLFETLWVSNPIRPRSAASRNRVMRGPGVTQGAKRSQGARRPRD